VQCIYLHLFIRIPVSPLATWQGFPALGEVGNDLSDLISAAPSDYLGGMLVRLFFILTGFLLVKSWL
jgi:hypothetical protein